MFFLNGNSFSLNVRECQQTLKLPVPGRTTILVLRPTVQYFMKIHPRVMNKPVDRRTNKMTDRNQTGPVLFSQVKNKVSP